MISIFSNFDVVRIIAPVFEINNASMKVLEKIRLLTGSDT
jgi:hypothetical protein